MKNCKNLSLIFYICFLLMLILTGCGENKVLQAFYVGETVDNASSSQTYSQFELWTSENLNSHIEKTAENSVTVKFNGAKYTGQYQYSYVELGTNYKINKYYFAGGMFSVNSTTGDLHSIYFHLDTTYEKEISIEDGARIAEQIAVKYLDVTDYEFRQKDMEFFYSYVYEKKLKDVYTYEKLALTVNYKGEIVGFAFYMGNAFPSPKDVGKYEDRINKLSSDEALALVESAAIEKYPQIITYNAPWCIEDKRIVLDDKNNLCMLYRVKVESTYDKNIVDENGNIAQTSHGVVDFILIK